MKFLASSLTLLALASISSVQAPSRDPKSDLAKKDECSIAGMVIKLAGSAPLKGAKIQLRNVEDRSHTIAVVTDVGGHFALKGLVPGSYRLSVSKNGFGILPRKYRVYRVRGRVQSLIAAVAPRRSRGINLSLAPKGGELETDNSEQQVLVDSKDDGAWQDPEFLRPVEDQGEKVELSESDQKTINITAIRTGISDQKP